MVKARRSAGDPSVERGDLQGDVRQLVELEQVLQLCPAQRAAARQAVQRRLVDHRPQLGSVEEVRISWRRRRRSTRRSTSSGPLCVSRMTVRAYSSSAAVPGTNCTS